MWVAWVHKVSALVKENGIVEMLVMSETCLYELLLRLYKVLYVILVSLFPKIKRLHQYVKSY